MLVKKASVLLLQLRRLARLAIASRCTFGPALPRWQDRAGSSGDLVALQMHSPVCTLTREEDWSGSSSTGGPIRARLLELCGYAGRTPIPARHPWPSRPSSPVLYIGRGPAFGIALEGALKLKEISYIHAEG